MLTPSSIPGQDSVKAYFSAIQPPFLLAGTVIAFLILWWWFFVKSGSTKFGANLIILVVTLLSLVAFGLRVEGDSVSLRLNIPEIAAIFVLFFLSELTLHLTARIETVADATAQVATNISAVRTELLNGDLVTVAKTLAQTLPIVELVKRVQNYPELENVLLEHVVRKNTTSWVEAVEKAMKQRPLDHVHAACWQVLIRRYMREEEDDLRNRIELSGSIFPNPQIATNDRLYLDMLRELASAAAAKPFLKEGRQIQFLAVTHLLPTWYYNWKHADGGEYAFQAMEGFRSAVVEIVRQSKRGGANYRYRRLCLITDNQAMSDEHAIPKKAELLNQYEAVLLTPSKPLPVDSPGSPATAGLVAIVKAAFPACTSLNAPPNRDAHLILSQADINKMIDAGAVAHAEGGVTSYKFSHGTDSYALYGEKLIERFVNSMHTSAADAEVGIVHAGDLAGLPNASDHDLLMVGYTEGGHTDWEFAISTNMRPGHETMLIHLVHDNGLLLRIADFYDSLQRAPLSNRDDVVNLT